MKYAFLLIFAFISTFMLSCKDDNTTVVDNSGVRRDTLPVAAIAMSPCHAPEQTQTEEFTTGGGSIEYFYDATTGDLTLVHSNFNSNCGTESVYPTATVADGIIIVTETAIIPVAMKCVCNFDLRFVIKNVSPGAYKLKYNELPEMEIILK